MWTCKGCGVQHEDGLPFCWNCGCDPAGTRDPDFVPERMQESARGSAEESTGSLDDLPVRQKVGEPWCRESDLARCLPIVLLCTRVASVLLILWASLAFLCSASVLVLTWATDFRPDSMPVFKSELISNSFSHFAGSMQDYLWVPVGTDLVFLIACTIVFRKADAIARWLVRAAW